MSLSKTQIFLFFESGNYVKAVSYTHLDVYKRQCLFFGDKRVGLAKREFDIVELLSQNPGQIFDKERILSLIHISGSDAGGLSSVGD